MARLLVVSRSMALAMRIADDHDVVEFPVDRLEELAPGKDVEALVLDLGEPSAAMHTLERLRSRGFDTRILIVSGYQPAWNDVVDLQIDRVVVVPLPITRAALLDGIDRLLGKTPLVPRVPPASRPAARANAPREPARPLAPPVGGGAGAPRPARADGGSRGTDAGSAAPAAARTGPGSGTSNRPAPAPGVMTPRPGDPANRPSRSAPSTSTPSTSTPSRAAPATAAAQTHPPGDEPGLPRRQGLDRLLGNGAQRPTLAPPSGSPLQPSGGARAPTSRGGPAGSPRAVPPANAGGAPEQDLFRPVVEPPVPARSPSVRPKSPGSGASPPPAPPAARSQPRRPGPAGEPDRSGQAGRPPAGRTGPARPSSVPPTPVPPPQPAPLQAPVAEPRPPSPSGPSRGGQPGTVRGVLRTARQRANDRHPGFTPASGLRAAEQADRPTDVHAWVRALLDRRSELFGVAETAQVLADEIIERGESDAAAVLVPDGNQWRVSGGVGLRPVERRLVLDTSHWLISEIAVGGRALLIEDTDIVRPRLAGAPLAAWRHLLAVPVPGMRAAVVLARGQEAARFTERDLAAVVPVVAEASPLLTAALQMRELARVLAPMRDVDGER